MVIAKENIAVADFTNTKLILARPEHEQLVRDNITAKHLNTFVHLPAAGVLLVMTEDKFNF
jgi:hypothetical protein